MHTDQRPEREAATDRGASTIIGTILVVSVVVILGSVVGVMAVSFVDKLSDPTPQITFEIEWEESTRTFTISHKSGDTFTDANTNRLEVVIHDDDKTGQNDFDVARKDWGNQTTGLPISTGAVFRITGESGDGDLDVERAGTNVANPGTETHEPEVDDMVRIIWYGTDDRSRILAEYIIESGKDP